MSVITVGALGFSMLVAPSGPCQSAEIAGCWGADYVLGTSFDLLAKGIDDVAAAIAAQEALREIQRLEQVLSNWRPGTEISALNSASVYQASPDLFAVISACERWRQKTSGAFSARTASLPGQPFDAAGYKRANVADVQLDSRRRLIHRPEPVRFDVDALAKGYILDAALAAARAAMPLASAMLINLGGDIRVWSAPESLTGWRLAVNDFSGAENARPLSHVELRNGALAASRAGPRNFTLSHPIRHGKTGATATTLGAAAIARTAADADALATALIAMDGRSARTFLQASPGYTGLLLGADRRVYAPRSWPGIEVDAPVKASAAWPAGYELSIGLELPDQGAGAERPYVVVWITNQDKLPVRTLLVLGREARWRESNYIYWRRIERIDAENVARIARQTRAPGRYDVVWDGLDDDGAAAAPGTYLINIEVSREHGGHSYVSIPMTLGPAAVSEAAEASEELGKVTVRYGRAL